MRKRFLLQKFKAKVQTENPFFVPCSSIYRSSYIKPVKVV